MSFYTELIDSIPMRTELSTAEIVKYNTGKTKDDFKDWEWNEVKNRTLTALNKGITRRDIVKIGYRKLPGENRQVMIWMRVRAGTRRSFRS